LPLDPIDTQTVLFASATLDVARPPREVEATLREGPAGWLTGLIEEAWQAEGGLLPQLSPDGRGRFPLREEAEVHSAVQLGEGLLVPLGWHSLSPDAIFPSAEIDLEATQSATGTRIEPRARLTTSTTHAADPAMVQAAWQYVCELTARMGAHLLSHLAA
jgi:hypothetical protein